MVSIVIKCFILICSVTVLDAVKFRCDYTFDTIGWYKYNEIPLSWRDARLQCRFEGAMLASPTTTKMKDIMKNAIRNHEIFTGIHATFSKGQYYTIDGIHLSEIPHTWAAYEPDNKNDDERCLVLNSDGDLSDVKCDEPRPFICFREYSRQDVNLCGTRDPEYHFESRTNKCYKLHTNPRQFERAHFVCSAEGGHLAIINSAEESQVIVDIFARYPVVKMLGNFYKEVAFIGFQNWGENIDWMTIHGQTLQEAGFDTFATGQPDNAGSGEYCGSVFRNGLLNDAGCQSSYAFICEKKADYPPVCDSDEYVYD